MRFRFRVLTLLLLFPALLLSGCLDDDAPPAAPASTQDDRPGEADASAAPGPAAPAVKDVEICDDSVVFAYYQNGTWSDRVADHTFEVPVGTTNLSLELAMGDHALVEYEARVTDPDGYAWYNVRYVGYSVPNARGSAVREGAWGDEVQNDAAVAGTHTFEIMHKGPVQDLSYIVWATVCGSA